MTISLRKGHVLAGLLMVWLLPGIQPSTAQVLVQIGQNFTGSTYRIDSQALPPDANGAIGPNFFMEFINGDVTIYNKTNGAFFVDKKIGTGFIIMAILIAH